MIARNLVIWQMINFFKLHYLSLPPRQFEAFHSESEHICLPPRAGERRRSMEGEEVGDREGKSGIMV